MFPWKTIFIPTDFSPPSNHAVRSAAEIAVASGARLVLYHVTGLPAGLPVEVVIDTGAGDARSSVEAYARSRAQERLAKLAEPLRAQGIEVEVRIDIGSSAAETIVAAAKELGADLLVAGTHARRGLAHFFLGSVAETLVRQSPIPVLVVRAPEEPTPAS